jgi:hypothetical protein
MRPGFMARLANFDKLLLLRLYLDECF